MISTAPLTAEEFEDRREAVGISKAQLCAAAGIAVTTYNRWLAGRTDPRVGIYRRLIAVIEGAEMSQPKTTLQGSGKYFTDGWSHDDIKG